MSEVLKEIKKLRKEVKEVKNILTDETSRDYVQALIDNDLICNYSGLPSTKSYGDNSSIKNEELSQEYLDQWTCDICGEHTHEVEYDYLGNGTNHLQCELKLEYGEE